MILRVKIKVLHYITLQGELVWCPLYVFVRTDFNCSKIQQATADVHPACWEAGSWELI